MMKFRLSKSISILHPGDITAAAIPPQYHQGYFILRDTNWGKDFIIKDTVKYYLDKFLSPRTQAEVLEEIGQELHTSIAEIRKTCTAFFTFLRRIRILVPEKANEMNLVHPVYLKPGETIGSLEIVKIISTKKQVGLYLSRDKTDNNLYVIKLLGRHYFSNPERYEEELQHLRNEFEALQKTSHIPCLCRAFSFQEDSPCGAYIKLEYIKGRSLTHFICNTENLQEAVYYGLMRDIISTFSLIHQSKLIHGDIHPDNIMTGEYHRIKIIDLGLSLPEDTAHMDIIKIGGVMHFMPPERISTCSFDKFSKAPDFYSDVYQIGLVLYFILYARTPFTGFTWEELAEDIKHSKITFPEISIGHFKVPKALIQVIKKCTRKTRIKRYATASAVLADFERVFRPVPKTKLHPELITS